MEIAPLIREHKKFLFFGLLLTLFSTFGQTAFLAVFTPYLQDYFRLSAGRIGLIYSSATLLSAATLSCTGSWIDKIDLRRFTFYVCAVFSCGCLAMALTSSLPLLFFSYFLLRYSCQGLMTHTSMVSMARYYREHRGKALSIAAIGYPIGSATLPITAAMFLETHGFSGTWRLLTLAAVCMITPLLLLLLKDHGKRHQNYVEQLKTEDNHTDFSSPLQILKDWKFYLVLLGILTPGLINTGIFFQNSELLRSKNWPAYIYAASLANHAAGNVLGSFLAGILTDKYKAARAIAFYLFPMLAALLLLCFASSVWVMYVFMFGIGVSQGGSSVIVGAVWAELYGPKHIGIVRSWVSSAKVLFTAIAPLLFGVLVDRGVRFSTILIGCSGYTLTSIVSLSLVSFYLNRTKKQLNQVS